MDVPGGERDTMLVARRQMQPTDATGERCEICSLIGLHPTKTTTKLRLSSTLVSSIMVSDRQIHQMARLRSPHHDAVVGASCIVLDIMI